MQKQHLDIVALLQTQGPISYPPRVNIPYRPPGGHLEQEPLYPYPTTSRPLIKPFKSKGRQEHRNLADHPVGPIHVSYAQQQPYFGGAASTSHVDPMTSSHQTFGDMSHIPISTDPSSIPMTEFGQTSYAKAYSSGAAAAVASVSSVTSTVLNNQQPPPQSVDAGSPNSVVNTHPMVTNYLMSNSEQLQQSTTPPSQYASPQSAGYGNPSPGYESELTTEFIGQDPIMATSSAAGVVVSQSQLSPQNYSNNLATTPAVVPSPPQQQLPSYNSKFNNYSGMDPAAAAPPVSVYGTSTGSTRPLQHLPYVAESTGTGGGGGPLSLVNSDQSSYHHRTSPPHMGSVSSGSPSSAYPSPLQPSNELHTNYIHNGYAYSASSRTSPPSLTPSPESREDQLVNAHGTFHVEHHPHDFPTCHTHITPPDSGMTMV